MSKVRAYPRKATVLLVVAVLIVSTLPATVALAQIGESEPNDEQSAATPITVDETVDGEITVDDEDWFSFDGVAAGESVQVSTSVPTDADGVYVYLYGPDGYLTSDYVYAGETVTIGTTAVRSGTYYVRVFASSGGSSPYSFTATTVATDEFEPNEAQTTAVPVSQDAEVSGEITINDEDWFAFDGVAAGESVQVTASVPTDADGVYVYLYNGDGYLTSDYVYAGETVTVGTTAVRSGTHYVRVFASSGGSSPYSFTATTVATDEFEPNEEQITATSITRGTDVSGEITINDEDWFAFAGVTAGETVNVTASVPTDADGVYVYLYGPDSYLTSDYVYAGETIELGAIAERSGTYYVRVFTSSGGSSPYSFEVATGATDQYEPNENAATAATVPQGAAVSAEITAGDNDWFAVDGVAAGRVVTVDFEKPADADGLYVYLYTPAGGGVSVLDNEYVASGESTTTIGGTAEVTGTYYVRVFSSGSDTSSYTFTLDTAATDDFEPNEALGSAAAIDLGTDVSGEITINDQDWFALGDLPADRNLTASLTTPTGGTPLYVYVHGPDGSAVGSEYVDGTGTVTVATETAGAYYVRVFAAGRNTGSYTLNTSTGDSVPPQQPVATVVFDDQTSDGDEVEIASATLPAGGFVAVHDESGAIVGVSDYLANGSHEDVAVTLDPELEGTATLTAMAHTDDGDGTFDASADGPYTVDGVPVTDDAEVTVEDDPDPTATLDVADQTGNGSSLLVGTATATVDFRVVVTVDGTVRNESSFAAGESFAGAMALDPALTEDASVTVEIRDAATGESLASDEIEYTLESIEPELDYYQVDFAVGDPIEDLGESLYAEEDRLLRFAWGNTEEGITDLGSAWPSADVRDSIDYGHIGSDDGEATVTFTVADGEELTVSLVVYSMPAAAFDAETADEQELLTAETGTYGAGTHTITVDLPDDD